MMEMEQASMKIKQQPATTEQHEQCNNNAKQYEQATPKHPNQYSVTS
jgi:hypothetical protein